MVSIADSLSACSWMEPAVLSNTVTAPSMLYSSVMSCMRRCASFMACTDFSSPSCRIFPWTRSSSTFSRPRELSPRSLAAL